MKRTFLLLLSLLGISLLIAQNPPVKMGLWEKKMVNSRGSGQPDMTMTAKSCVTLQTWQDMVSGSMQPQPGCTIDVKKNANGYTFDGSCSLGDSGQAKGSSMMRIQGSSTIADSEHIVSESHSTVKANGNTRETSSHSTSHFVSASCGSIKPGEPEIDGAK